MQVNLVGRNAQARLGQSYNLHAGKVGGVNSILGNKNALFFGRNPDQQADGHISGSNKSIKGKGIETEYQPKSQNVTAGKGMTFRGDEKEPSSEKTVQTALLAKGIDAGVANLKSAVRMNQTGASSAMQKHEQVVPSLNASENQSASFLGSAGF